jgi:hypothetical protein
MSAASERPLAHPVPKQLLHLALFLGGSGEKLIPSAILWTAGMIAIRRERNSESMPGSYWRGMLIISWAIISHPSHGAGLAGSSNIHLEIHDLQFASGGYAGKPWDGRAPQAASRFLVGDCVMRSFNSNDPHPIS